MFLFFSSCTETPNEGDGRGDDAGGDDTYEDHDDDGDNESGNRQQRAVEEVDDSGTGVNVPLLVGILLSVTVVGGLIAFLVSS